MSSFTPKYAADHLSIAAEFAGVGTWEVEPQSGDVYMDLRTRELFAIGPDEEIDIDSFLLKLHPEDRGRVVEAIERAYDPAHGKYDCEYRIDADGDVRWIWARGCVRFDDAGQPKVFLGMVQDITVDKQALAERERLVAEAEEANRAKDDFLAMLGHELRNPLAPVLLATKLLRDRGESSRELAIIERQSRHMSRIVDDLLDISRITRGKLSLKRVNTRLTTIIEKAVETIVLAFDERQQRLEVELPPHPVRLYADADRIVQVISNLLRNASKFSDDGGLVRLVASTLGDDACRIDVRDFGVGFSEKDRPKLFEPFQQRRQTVERADGGLGLGLAIANQIVSMHHGELVAQSPGPGQGATFSVILPLGTLVEKTSVEPEPVSTPTDQRILLVEDNEDLRELLAIGLESRGFVVREAGDGEAGIEAAEAWKPDVVLCDIGLPHIDGFGVAQRLRTSLGPDVRLIALSGYGLPADRARSLEAGFDDHLTKPVGVEQILRCLAEHEPRT
ncbi:MAG: ATP-binding protein [Nannocystaceae bacterium]|nr:response regulator [bacterium]